MRTMRPISLIFLLGALAAQGVPVDEDPTALPLHGLTTNAVHTQRNFSTQRNAHAVRNHQVITGKQVVVGSSGATCDLLVDVDGHLRLEGCWLRVHGDVFLKDRGVLELVDCRVQFENTIATKYGVWWEGGELRTTRCVIGGTVGGNGDTLASVFHLNRGHWQIVDTTVQYSGGILIGQGRAGYTNDPFLRGGSLFADGLHQGVDADAVVASGYGDITLWNSTFNVSVALYADSGLATHSAFDFRTNQVIPWVVYGDQAVLGSMIETRHLVTNDFPGMPYRLELKNCVVPFWFVGVFGVVGSGPRTTFELQDPAGLIVGIHATDLTGSPIAVGPWSQYVTRIPQLPTVQAGGYDVIPPGCGVRIGNVDLVAPANRPAAVSGWSFYFDGTATNFSVQGPTNIPEINMVEGQFSIQGREAYDARLSGNTIKLHRNSILNLTNVSIGRFESTVGFEASIQLQGVATCTIDRALIEGLRVRSTGEQFAGPYQGQNQATFNATNFVERNQPLDAVASGQSTFSVQRATSAQAFDLQNQNMDAAPVGNTPPFWASTNLTATASVDTRPSSTSAASTALAVQAATATMAKTLPIEPGTVVAVRAWFKPLQVPPGASLQVRIAGAVSVPTVVSVPLSVPAGNNGWRQIVLPPHHVLPLDGPITIECQFAGSGLQLRVDDFDIRPSCWFDRTNLANLDFDGSDVLGYGFPPQQYRYPAFWGTWNCNASWEAVNVRPGAAVGSHGVRLVVDANAEAHLYKVLEDLAPGTVVHVTGWMRVLAPQATPLKVSVGDDAHWWDPIYATQVYVNDARNWVPFTANYTVAPGITKTRIIVHGGLPGLDVLVDDLEVTLQ